MLESEIKITAGDGRPLSELSKLIKERAKYLDETAEQSCAAVMIDVLVSLRALTKTASPKRSEVKVTQTALVPSFTQSGKNKPVFCLRLGKAKYQPASNERIGHAQKGRPTKEWKNCHVYKWIDNHRGKGKDRVWLIVARSQGQAETWALNKIRTRAKRFKGLARLAMSKLMNKAGSTTGGGGESNSNANIIKKSEEMTQVQATKNGSYYTLEAKDLLDYAKAALKGGDSSINEALMKAANKIAAMINHKCKNLLLFDKLETPFPDIRQKGK